MKRVIIDYKNLNETILDLVKKRYPHGYNKKDIIRFYNAQNNIMECVEVKTDTIVYLVKIGSMLTKAMILHDLKTDTVSYTHLTLPTIFSV